MRKVTTYKVEGAFIIIFPQLIRKTINLIHLLATRGVEDLLKACNKDGYNGKWMFPDYVQKQEVCGEGVVHAVWPVLGRDAAILHIPRQLVVILSDRLSFASGAMRSC